MCEQRSTFNEGRAWAFWCLTVGMFYTFESGRICLHWETPSKQNAMSTTDFNLQTEYLFHDKLSSAIAFVLLGILNIIVAFIRLYFDDNLPLVGGTKCLYQFCLSLLIIVYLVGAAVSITAVVGTLMLIHGFAVSVALLFIGSFLFVEAFVRIRLMENALRSSSRTSDQHNHIPHIVLRKM